MMRCEGGQDKLTLPKPRSRRSLAQIWEGFFMRIALAFGLFCLTLAPAGAETLSEEIARTGLAATEARLTAAASADPAEAFGLGGVQFLRAVEQSYQLRWQTGLADPTGMLPFLRLPMAPNPEAATFDPATLTRLFAQASAQLGLAQQTLATVPDGADFGVEIALADLWFDVNSSGSRDPGEGTLDMLGPILLGWQWDQRDPALDPPVIRFDAADAAWLSAYAHLLAGLCDMIRAYDPTEPITRVTSARAAMQALGPITGDPFLGTESGVDSIDILAVLLATLEQQPDAALMASARDHLLSMVADNRIFWARVATEADDDREWLPNDRQTSALGISLPPGTGTRWLAVLADAEAILNGDLLVPYWRLGGSAGVNVGRMFSEPAPIDLAGWVQGWAALPYLEQGKLVSPDNWMAFAGMLEGDPMLLALWLN
jgi:hypothetical protein